MTQKLNTKVGRRKFVKSISALATISVMPRYVLGGNGYIPPSDKINFGVIGTGKQAMGLANRFAKIEEATVLAGSDIDPRKLARFKTTMEEFYRQQKSQKVECHTYAHFEELLERSDIDAVIVATPDHWHASPTIMAAKAGKDIFCEKPLSHTISEGREMVKAVRKNDRILQTGSMQRSWKNFRDACELVRNGHIGKIEKVIVSVGDPAVPCDLPAMAAPEGLDWDRWIGSAAMRPYHTEICPPLEDNSWAMWRKYEEFGGGILADWGAHMFDIAQWGLGMDNTGPVSIIPPTVNATRGCKFMYANGVEMVHDDFGRGWAVRFIGSNGSIDISREVFETSDPEIMKSIGSGAVKLYKSDNHYLDTIKAIKERAKPVCDVEIGHRSATICHLGNIAYKLKRPLEWDPKREKFKGDKEANKMISKDYRKPYTLKAKSFA